MQELVLAALAPIPGWSLTGGAGLAGFHLAHRQTRDLDLFIRAVRRLPAETVRAVEDALAQAGLEVTRQTTSDHFVRWLVATAEETTVLDLVAEPVDAIEDPERHAVAGATIAVDSAYEILVNKLCALISRTELRDLVDVRALLSRGLPLAAALADAPRKDAGFSPLVLGHTLGSIDFAAANRRAHMTGAELSDLQQFARELADACVGAAWNG